MRGPADPDRLIRCRVSNGVDYAAEFSASDGRSLCRGVEHALARIEAAGKDRLGRGGHTVPLRCVLQVRPRSVADAAAGWYAPCRRTAQGAAVYVEVVVSRSATQRRPADDWNEVWTWVQNSRGHDDQTEAFVRDTGRLLRGIDDDE